MKKSKTAFPFHFTALGIFFCHNLWYVCLLHACEVRDFVTNNHGQHRKKWGFKNYFEIRHEISHFMNSISRAEINILDETR